MAEEQFPNFQEPNLILSLKYDLELLIAIDLPLICRILQAKSMDIFHQNIDPNSYKKSTKDKGIKVYLITIVVDKAIKTTIYAPQNRFPLIKIYTCSSYNGTINYQTTLGEKNKFVLIWTTGGKETMIFYTPLKSWIF